MNWTSPLIILLAFGLYAGLHSLLAGPRAKRWASERFGDQTYRRYYRLIFNFLGVLTLLPVMWLVWRLPDTPLYSLSGLLLALFVVVELAGVLILAAALTQTDGFDFLGLRQLADPSVEPQLVTGSVYAWMRHPLYTGSLLVLWFLPAMSLNLLALVVAVTVYFYVGAMFEERKLERYFGSAYSRYKVKTGMFLPRL